MAALSTRLKRTVGNWLLPLAERAAKSYIAGPELRDALRVARDLAKRDFTTTLGFWDGEGHTPALVADEYLAALDAIRDLGHESYLSIKLPALGDSLALVNRLVERSLTGSTGIRIHFDSLAPQAADAMWAAALEAARGGARVSCSLPGRWRRRLADAELAVSTGIIPRVVKGQWPDADPDADLRQGFMNVVEQLAGRAPRVAVASHDAPLACKAVQCLRAAGTECEMELLYGLPQRASLALAQRESVPVRFYVPYGRAYLPYCLGQMRRQPRLAWWLMRDSLSSIRGER